MPDRSADRHADPKPLTLRLGPLRQRLEAHIKRNGGTLTGFATVAVREKLDREEAVPGGKPAHAYVQREPGDPEYGCAVCGGGRELHKRAQREQGVP